MPLVDLRHVEPERLHLVQAGLQDAGRDLRATGQARGGGDDEGQLGGGEVGLPGDVLDHGVGRQVAALQHQHAAGRLLRVVQLLEQLLLDPRVGPERARSHREVLVHLDRPAGVLGRHAGNGGMVGGHLHAGPVLSAQVKRGVLDLPKASHADLAHQQARVEAAVHRHPGVDHGGAGGEGLARDAQAGGILDHGVRDLAGAFIHRQAGHRCVHAGIPRDGSRRPGPCRGREDKRNPALRQSCIRRLRRLRRLHRFRRLRGSCGRHDQTINLRNL